MEISRSKKSVFLLAVLLMSKITSSNFYRMLYFYKNCTMVVYVRLLLILTLITGCTTYPKFEYEAIDNKGKKLIVHEYKGSYEEHRHSIGDTVAIHTVHGHYGQIREEGYDGTVIPSYKFKNVIITKIK